MSSKMKRVEQVCELLKKEGIEPSQQEVSAWIMRQIRQGTYYAGEYGNLKQGDFALYFREFYGNVA